MCLKFYDKHQTKRVGGQNNNKKTGISLHHHHYQVHHDHRNDHRDDHHDEDILFQTATPPEPKKPAPVLVSTTPDVALPAPR